MINITYKNNKNGNKYIVIDICKSKDTKSRKWYNAVIYREIKDYMYYGDTYTRCVVDFNNKFTISDISVTSN